MADDEDSVKLRRRRSHAGAKLAKVEIRSSWRAWCLCARLDFHFSHFGFAAESKDSEKAIHRE